VPEDFEHPNEPVRIPITDVFDLHSVPPRDIQGVVEAYLEEAHRMGFRAVRIIHGRGIGVQRQTVRAVLARTSFVVSYGDAPMEAGGWGATIATLAAFDTRRNP
jgi:dsDNA-specific endonuclease/ATPase MutS2